MPTREEKLQLIKSLEARNAKQKFNKIDSFFKHDGPFRRELYTKHVEFFKAGTKYKERAFIAANQCGKTTAGCYEVACHALGRYPEWWEGHRFEKAPNIWVVGYSADQVKKVLQFDLVGPKFDLGTGLIPKEFIERTTHASMPPESVREAFIKHSSGSVSTISFLNGGQGREYFQGSKVDFVLCDEEIPQEISSEILLRTIATKGKVIYTFTPLQGLTELVLSFLPGGMFPQGGIGEVVGPTGGSRWVCNVSWDDVPHLTKDEKDSIMSALSPHEKEARSKGLPSIGSGAIYPVSESVFVLPPFRIPDHYKKAYGLDVGWNNTAAIFAGYNEEEDTWVIYAEYLGQKQEPAVNAAAIRARSQGWVRGVVDPASMGVSQSSGESLMDLYRKNGLDVEKADNSVEPGLLAVYQRLTEGRLKIFSTCVKLLEELRLYHRDSRGKPVKKMDHLLDAMRYLIMSGEDVMQCEPAYEDEQEMEALNYRGQGANQTTGY